MKQPTPPVPPTISNMGEPRSRYEAHAKVTGKPIYAADVPIKGLLQAYFVSAGIAKGSVASIDTSEAQAIPGVVKIYTHRNAPHRMPVKFFLKGGPMVSSVVPLMGTEIAFDGQAVAMVIAESYEAAREAASRVVVRYLPAPNPAATLESDGAETIAAAAVLPRHKDKSKGDAEAALAAAPVKVDARYRTPAQHHNAMELFSTTAVWAGDELTLYEPSQFVWGLKTGTAEHLGVPADKVHVINPWVGGAFGGKGVQSQRTALIAGAARDLDRPIRCVLTRQQGFDHACRAETRHHVRLGATKDGKLTAYCHEAWELTSRADDYLVAGTQNTVEMWGAPAIWTKVNLVRADRQTPSFMRSPAEVPYVYALETAMDELAVALAIDPVELRRINDTMVSPISGQPYTSRSVMKCFDEAAAAFGWARRNPKPASMRDGDWMIGYGTATAIFPTKMRPSTARVRLSADGSVLVQTASHDVGTGAYTVLAQVAAERLGVPVGHVTIRMGDTALPPGGVAGGSSTTASAGSAIHAACDKIARRFGSAMPTPADLSAAFERLGTNAIEEYAEFAHSDALPDAVKELYLGHVSGSGGADVPGKPLMFAFGAEFVEVRIHSRTREIRVPRMTGAFAGGRILNPRTARSQYLGGMIWGMASALLEKTDIDEKRARYVNDNFAEYLIAVNADVPQIDIIMVPEEDTQVNALGVKGIGELANVGTAAAISNAVFHATGKRIRDLPITMDKLI